MADDASYVLVCLIEGESSIFKVELARNRDIMDLKKCIKEERKNSTLSSVDSIDLILWKVRMIMASDSTTNSPAG